jgi:hypothetical protein
MKRVILAILFLLLAVPAAAQQKVLMLHPSKAPTARQYLLPKRDELTDADAKPLYDNAAEALPADVDTKQISEWLKTSLQELPRDQVQPTLQRLGPALKFFEQATKCKNCNWPAVAPGTMLPDLNEYRTIARGLALQARLQMAKGEYDKALATTRTGLAAARQIGESPILIQGLVGTAIGALMIGQVEDFVQGANAPNLYRALRDLPKPLVDLNKPIVAEVANLRSSPQYNALTRRSLEKQLKSSHDRVRMLMKRLERHIAALQCIEALRLCAADRGKFPGSLGEIKDMRVPDDLITGKPFVYSSTGSEASLQGPAPQGGKPKEAIDYKLILKK